MNDWSHVPERELDPQEADLLEETLEQTIERELLEDRELDTYRSDLAESLEDIAKVPLMFMRQAE